MPSGFAQRFVAVEGIFQGSERRLHLSEAEEADALEALGLGADVFAVGEGAGNAEGFIGILDGAGIIAHQAAGGGAAHVSQRQAGGIRRLLEHRNCTIKQRHGGASIDHAAQEGAFQREQNGALIENSRGMSSSQDWRVMRCSLSMTWVPTRSTRSARACGSPSWRTRA